MNAFVTTNSRFGMTPDGELWTPTTPVGYSFWARYLDVYERAILLARVRPIEKPPESWAKASGPGIDFIALPYFQGPGQFLLKRLAIRRQLADVLQKPYAIHLRAPCAAITDEVWRLIDVQRPYGIEVVGDPWDAFAPNAIKHPLSFIFRRWFARILRQQCAQADAAAYVTEKALQCRYPPPAGAFTTHYSSITLKKDEIVPEPREYEASSEPLELIAVGTMRQMYKGHDILLEAVAANLQDGLDIRLSLLGGGEYQPFLENLAQELGIADSVDFTGHISKREEVLRRLDNASCFVMPSRQEGLPKAMIEAMARALPCIGTEVGGIPELIPDEYVVPPDDVKALAEKIREVVTDPEGMTAMSKRNLEKAREYEQNVLRRRRQEFYGHVKSLTEEWLQRSNCAARS